MSGPSTVAAPQARAYLAAVAAGLAGPRPRRERILAELGEGLDQAATAHRAAGLAPPEAIRAAIDGFGTPTAVADAFADELATASARRILGGFVVTGPLVGGLWLFLLHPYPWRAGLAALLTAIPVLPLVAVALATVAGTLATTGRLIRWLPEAGPHRALAAAIGVAVLVAGTDTTLIAMYLSSGLPPHLLAVIAVAASLIRIGCSLAAVHHATALRQRLAGRDADR